MASKYATVVRHLAPLPPADIARQVKIDTVKDEILARKKPQDASTYNRLLGLLHGGLDVVPEERVEGLVGEYARLREVKEDIDALSSLVSLRITALEQLLDASQDAGEDGWGKYGVGENAVRLPDGSTIRIQREPYGKVMDREAFRLWCIKNGYERQLQLWPSTMNSLVKERLMAGEQPPDGTEAFSYTKIVYTPAKQ